MDKSAHAVYCLNYHLILCTKYRHKVINNTVSNKIQELFSAVGTKHGIIIEEWNYEADHIHILLNSKPQSNLLQFIQSAKSYSSRIIKQQNKQFYDIFKTGAFWSRSYCLLSCGNNLDVVRKYIESQEHDA